MRMWISSVWWIFQLCLIVCFCLFAANILFHILYAICYVNPAGCAIKARNKEFLYAFVCQCWVILIVDSLKNGTRANIYILKIAEDMSPIVDEMTDFSWFEELYV